VRRGGRSSLGRHSAWPPARGLAYLGSDLATVVGGTLWLVLGLNVGLTVLGVGLMGRLNVWLYNRRWARLQGEVFVKRGVALWRQRWARRLVRWAEVVDPGSVLRTPGYRFTYEKGLGMVWREGGLGCPVWYYERDWPLAHEHAERRV
jgi:hypothetical protein